MNLTTTLYYDTMQLKRNKVDSTMRSTGIVQKAKQDQSFSQRILQMGKQVCPDKRCSLYQELRPILFVLRLSPRFPYIIDSEGDMQIRANSAWMVYTVLMYGAQTFLAYQNLVTIIETLRSFDSKLEEYLSVVTTLMFLFMHFQFPLISLREWPCIARYFNRWRRFQLEFLSLTGVKIEAFCKHAPLVSVVLIIPSVGFVTYINSDAFFLPSLLHVIPYYMLFTYCNMYLLAWVFINIEISHASSKLKQYVSEVFSEEGNVSKARKLMECRRLWIGLSGLAGGLGDALAFTMITFSAACIAEVVITTYVLMTWFVNGNVSNIVPFALILVITTSYIYTIAELADRTTRKVGQAFYEDLIKVDTTQMDQRAVQEVNIFIQTINLNPPNIQLAGFFTVNRGLIISLVSNVVTYLVVLIQFKAAGQ